MDEDKQKYDEQNKMISFVMRIPELGSSIRTINISTPDNIEGKSYSLFKSFVYIWLFPIYHIVYNYYFVLLKFCWI